MITSNNIEVLRHAMRTLKIALQLAMIFIFCAPSFSAYSSDYKRDVPKSLFGIELGKVYNFTDITDNKFNYSDWPVKIITGIIYFDSYLLKG